MLPSFSKGNSEAVLKSGSYVSVDALIDLALWNIDTYMVTKRNRVVAVLRNLEDDSHVETRVSQYEALNNKKGLVIAKQFLLSKLEGQNKVLKKYGLKPLEIESVKREIESAASENLKIYRRRLTQIEAKCSRLYFKEIFTLFPENIRPESRRTFKAYDGLNNVFNFGYYVLKCRVHKALLKAN